jgi:hypothetical protein
MQRRGTPRRDMTDPLAFPTDRGVPALSTSMGSQETIEATPWQFFPELTLPLKTLLFYRWGLRVIVSSSLSTPPPRLAHQLPSLVILALSSHALSTVEDMLWRRKGWHHIFIRYGDVYTAKRAPRRSSGFQNWNWPRSNQLLNGPQITALVAQDIGGRAWKNETMVEESSNRTFDRWWHTCDRTHMKKYGYVSQDPIGGFSTKRECTNTHISI